MSRELRYQRLLQASPARVFDLFTNPAGQREFYGNDAPGWLVDSRCELRVGGAWEIAFGPSPGELYRHRHVFEAIERPRRLLLATTETRLDGSRLAFSTEFTFVPQDGATLMTMVQWGFPSGELREEHGRGLPHAFDRVERALSAPERGERMAKSVLYMSHPQAKVHRMFELVEPVATVSFSEGATNAFLELGMRNYWDGYFAGRAAPLGLAPAGVVHAVFYNFADGEVARHIPWVWGKTTPAEAIAVRERGSAAELRQMIGEAAGTPGLVRVADLATRAAVSAPTEGRVLYAGLRALDVPEEPVARLWHAATLLREHRGDGHNAALVAHGIGGTEAHVLLAVSLGMRPEEFSRIHHLPRAQLAAVVDGLRGRALVDAAGGLTDAGREIRERIEARTDELAAAAYDVLSADELDELIAGLEPIAAAVSGIPH